MDLSTKHPIIVVENITPHAHQIQYGSGDSVQINGGARRSISTVGLHQIPDTRFIRMVKPTLAQLVSEGLIASNNVTPAPSEPPAAVSETPELPEAKDHDSEDDVGA